jgi:hypothetical protein
MLVTRLDVPRGMRLLFQTTGGPVSPVSEFRDLGMVTRAERHADPVQGPDGPMDDHRVVLDCDGVEASAVSQLLHWPPGETLLEGTARFGDTVFPAALQIRVRPGGLRAILRQISNNVIQRE